MAIPPQARVSRSMFLLFARRSPTIPSFASMSSDKGSIPCGQNITQNLIGLKSTKNIYVSLVLVEFWDQTLVKVTYVRLVSKKYRQSVTGSSVILIKCSYDKAYINISSMGFWVTYVNILIHVAYINKEAHV